MDPMPTVKTLINTCQIYPYYLIAQCTIVASLNALLLLYVLFNKYSIKYA